MDRAHEVGPRRGGQRADGELSMEDMDVLRIGPQDAQRTIDLVAEEVPLTIFAGGEELATLLASPSNLDELAVGFLYSSGLIEAFAAIEHVRVDERRWSVHVALHDVARIDPQLISRRLFSSGCGRGMLFYSMTDIAHTGARGEVRLGRDALFGMMHDFQKRSPEFQDTGCVHSAALATGTQILFVREDIGRHNAVDKVLGGALMQGVPLEDKIILSSGRISSEIVLKVRKTAISTLVSRSAPTNQAVRHARGADITLVGFARGKRMNVYSGERRIT